MGRTRSSPRWRTGAEGGGLAHEPSARSRLPGLPTGGQGGCGQGPSKASDSALFEDDDREDTRHAAAAADRDGATGDRRAIGEKARGVGVEARVRDEDDGVLLL